MISFSTKKILRLKMIKFDYNQENKFLKSILVKVKERIRVWASKYNVITSIEYFVSFLSGITSEFYLEN